jgi:predicted mannosyl-3-phosphoglycerate phosphatase (HAD superfamily)
MRFIVFTDLDALLDSVTYEWRPAQDALSALKMLNSSLVFAPPDDFSGVR